MREHRLYQADWLLRFYGFARRRDRAARRADGMLDLEIDPKLAWALRNRQRFPVDVNRRRREMLLRVPGLGKRAVDRIVAARRHRRLRLDGSGAPHVLAEARAAVRRRGGPSSDRAARRRESARSG